MDMDRTETETEITNSFFLFGRMKVEYEGRASSTLAVGNYLLVRKPDGSTFIHGSDLITPLNYQPAGSKMFQTGWLLAVRSKKEEMRIEVFEVHNLYRPKEWSDDKIVLVRTEKQLRDYLAAHICDYIPDIVTTFTEYQTPVGPIDLVGVDSAQVHHVFEVKRHSVSVNTVTQLRKYLEALPDDKISRGYVVAPKINDNAIKYAERHRITYLPLEHR